MKFKIVKDKNITNKSYVWHEGVCLGYFVLQIKENKNIDWPKYRADKTLCIDPKERWYIETYPIAYPHNMCGKYNTELEAALALLEKHNKLFDELEDFKMLETGDHHAG